MNDWLAYVASTFYECILTASDKDQDSMLEGAIKLHTVVGPDKFDKILKKARWHLAILSAAKNQKEDKDESVSASQEESPVASRDHKE